MSVGIWACQRAALAPGDDVLVTGAGPIGLVSAAAARALGAGSVTVTDVSDFRLELGAVDGVRDRAGGRALDDRFDVLIECSAAPGVLAEAMGRLRPAGRVADLIGMSRRTRSRCLPSSTARSSRSASSTATRTRGQRPSGSWPRGASTSKPLITHRFPLADTDYAMTLGSHVDDSVKAMVHPQQ